MTEKLLPLSEIDKKEYMSTADACKLLSISRPALTKKLQQGVLGYVRQNSRRKNIWVSRRDVIEHSKQKIEIKDDIAEQKVRSKAHQEKIKKQEEASEVDSERYLDLTNAEVQRRLKYEQMVKLKRENKIAEGELVYVKDVVAFIDSHFSNLYDKLRNNLDRARIGFGWSNEQSFKVQKLLDDAIQDATKATRRKFKSRSD